MSLKMENSRQAFCWYILTLDVNEVPGSNNIKNDYKERTIMNIPLGELFHLGPGIIHSANCAA